MGLVARLAFMLALLGVGLGARHAGVLEGARRDRLNAVAFYGVLPALIFTLTYDRPLRELLSAELVVGLLVTYAAVAGVAWVVHRRTEPAATRSVAVIQSYHGNFGYLGLPLVTATLGAAAGGRASVVLGVGTLTQVPLTILVLIGINEADASLGHEVRNVVANPVLLSLVLGLGVAGTGAPVPEILIRALGLVGDLALPIALVLVGSAFVLRVPDADPGTLGATVATKVLVMPAVAFAAFTALGAPPLVRNAGVVMLGAPAAVSTFVYATELGGDAEFASVGVFATTLASVGTLGVVLGLLV